MFCRDLKSPILLAYYKKYCKILREVIKTAKRIHYNKLILNSNKSKTIWNIVNNETGKYNNRHDPPPLTRNGKKIKNCLHIANAFNAYFSTMIDKTLNGSHINPVSNVNNDKFSRSLSTVAMEPVSALKCVSVTSREIKDIIKSLNNKNSSGYDEISSEALKSSMPYILTPLIHIYVGRPWFPRSCSREECCYAGSGGTGM
jgi:hypothetical protein